jgi:hypothetical protein
MFPAVGAEAAADVGALLQPVEFRMNAANMIRNETRLTVCGLNR